MWRVCLQCGRPRFNPCVSKIPWRVKWLPTPIFLPGESHGQRSLAGNSPWCHKESDTTERLTLLFWWGDSRWVLGWCGDGGWSSEKSSHDWKLEIFNSTTTPFSKEWKAGNGVNNWSWLLWSPLLYNRPVNTHNCCRSSVNHSSKWLNLRRGSWKPWFIASRSEVWVALDLQLAFEMGVVLWYRALNLWDLMLLHPDS